MRTRVDHADRGLVLRALLEGLPPEALQTDFPVFLRLVSSYRSLVLTEHAALAEAALTFSTGLGFLTFKGYLEGAVAREGSDWGSLRPTLMRLFLTRHVSARQPLQGHSRR